MMILMVSDYPGTDTQGQEMYSTLLQDVQNGELASLIQKGKFELAKKSLQIQHHSREITDLSDTLLCVESAAHTLRRQENFMAAIFLYLVAADLYQSNRKGKMAVIGVCECVEEIGYTIGRVRDATYWTKILITQTVIPHMHVLRRVISEPMRKINVNLACVKEARCWQHISRVHILLGHTAAGEKCFRRGLQLMEEHFGLECRQYKVYFHLIADRRERLKK